MDPRGEIAISRYARALALLSLLVGLGDAARLVGLEGGDVSPVTRLGIAGFTLLAIFAVMRLFAAVGLWGRAHWGALLLATATGVELLLSITNSAWVALGLMEFILKLVVLLATIGFLVVTRITLRRQLAD